MFLVILLIIIASLVVWSETISGKFVLGGGILALGSIILYWILDIEFLFAVAKWSFIIAVFSLFAAIFTSIVKS